MAFSDIPIQVVLCLGASAVQALELYEQAQKDFPTHTAVLVAASDPPTPSMLHLDDPIEHLGCPVEITWRVYSGWGRDANPQTVDWVMRNWSPHLYLPRENDVDAVEEIADLDEFDRMLEGLDVRGLVRDTD